jgi:mRNA-degrading endonuclease RelE of RelBE toxin-antitoxin system
MIRRVRLRPAVAKQFQRLDRADVDRIAVAIRKLAETGIGDVKPLQGEFKGQFRLRVGHWRILFFFEAPDWLVVSNVDTRGQSY